MPSIVQTFSGGACPWTPPEKICHYKNVTSFLTNIQKFLDPPLDLIYFCFQVKFYETEFLSFLFMFLFPRYRFIDDVFSGFLYIDNPCIKVHVHRKIVFDQGPKISLGGFDHRDNTDTRKES